MTVWFGRNTTVARGTKPVGGAHMYNVNELLHPKLSEVDLAKKKGLIQREQAITHRKWIQSVNNTHV